MAEVVSEFFTVVWVDMVPPDNLAELIPYLLAGGGNRISYFLAGKEYLRFAVSGA